MTLIHRKDYNVFGLVGDTTKIDERDVLANPVDRQRPPACPRPISVANRLFPTRQIP